MIDARNVHATIGKHMLADGMDQVIDLKKSHGSWLVDARDGKEYLDLFSMFATMSVGYNHPTLLENRERIAAAALNKITNSDIYSTQMQNSWILLAVSLNRTIYRIRFTSKVVL